MKGRGGAAGTKRGREGKGKDKGKRNVRPRTSKPQKRNNKKKEEPTEPFEIEKKPEPLTAQQLKERKEKIVDRMKPTWVKLSLKKTPAAEKKKLLDKLFNQMKNRAALLATHHVGARIISMLFKHGNCDVRNSLHAELREHYASLACTRHASHAVRAVLNYASRAARSEVINELLPKTPRLLAHADAAKIMDFIYGKVALGPEQHRLESAVWGLPPALMNDPKRRDVTLKNYLKQHPSAEPAIAATLTRVATTLIRKGLCHGSLALFALFHFFQHGEATAIRDAMTGMPGAILDIAPFPLGARISLHIIHHMRPKDLARAALALQRYVPALAADSWGCVVLATMLLRAAALDQRLPAEDAPEDHEPVSEEGVKAPAAWGKIAAFEAEAEDSAEAERMGRVVWRVLVKELAAVPWLLAGDRHASRILLALLAPRLFRTAAGSAALEWMATPIPNGVVPGAESWEDDEEGDGKADRLLGEYDGEVDLRHWFAVRKAEREGEEEEEEDALEAGVPDAPRVSVDSIGLALARSVARYLLSPPSTPVGNAVNTKGDHRPHLARVADFLANPSAETAPSTLETAALHSIPMRPVQRVGELLKTKEGCAVLGALLRPQVAHLPRERVPAGLPPMVSASDQMRLRRHILNCVAPIDGAPSEELLFSGHASRLVKLCIHTDARFASALHGRIDESYAHLAATPAAFVLTALYDTCPAAAAALHALVTDGTVESTQGPGPALLCRTASKASAQGEPKGEGEEEENPYDDEEEEDEEVVEAPTATAPVVAQASDDDEDEEEESEEESDDDLGGMQFVSTRTTAEAESSEEESSDNSDEDEDEESGTDDSDDDYDADSDDDDEADR